MAYELSFSNAILSQLGGREYNLSQEKVSAIKMKF